MSTKSDSSRRSLTDSLTGAVSRLRGSSSGSIVANTRAQGTNLTRLFMGVLIAGIIVVSVFIPVMQEQINKANVSGSTETVLLLIPLFAGLLLLVSLASPLMRRV